MSHPYSHYQESAAYLRAQLGEFVPKVALILGSGLGDLAQEVEDAVAVPYASIPHFPRSTAPGHVGQLVFGTLAGKPVAVMQGRVHHYEGYSYEDVAYGVRVLRLLGCDTLLVTNAAGCVRPDWNAGDIMLLTDQIKLGGESPLRGENLPEFGVRFPDASHLYTPRLQAVARQVAQELGRTPTFTAWGPSMSPPPRFGPSGPWAGMRWACPPPPRSSWPPTVAWRCWASRCCPTWPPGCCPSP